MPEKIGLDAGFDLPFQEQVDFFRNKLTLGTRAWDDIMHEAHDRAFVVAGAMKADLLADLRRAVDRAIDQGTSLKAFREDFKQIVFNRGWTGWTGEGSAAGFNWRTKVIWETNLRASYAAGRWAQLNDPGLKKLMPFWRYVHADSVMSPRPLHLAWGQSRLTLPADHPFWKTHFPPNGWGCRCRVTAVAAPKPGDATEPPEGWDEIDEKTGAPAGIDKGWGYAPGASNSDDLKELVRQKAKTLPAPLGKALAANVEQALPRLAKSVADASRIAKEIIDEQGKPWPIDEQSLLPAVRFSHPGVSSRAEVRAKKLYQASLSGLDLDTANFVNNWLTRAQSECDTIGIPRLRGVNTSPGAAFGCMGDGVLSITKYCRVGGKVYQPPKTYQLSDGDVGRPENVRDFFATMEERIEKTMWHEFGHHIHQTFGVKNYAQYKSPPLEARLAKIISDQKTRFGSLDFPSKYAKENYHEYFAEVYSAHKMGRDDLVPSFMKPVIEKIERGEMP